MNKRFKTASEIRNAWNDGADVFNQWETLSEDEKIEFANELTLCGHRQWQPIESAPKGESVLLLCVNNCTGNRYQCVGLYALDIWHECLNNWGEYNSIKIEDPILMWKALDWPEVME